LDTNLTKKRVTQADVAQSAQVSQAMVSYVISGSSVSIPDNTRKRIVEAMEELGYVPNVTARRLRRGKTLTIAGIIPDITNPFYPAFERGIQDIVDKQNYDLIIYNTDGTKSKEEKCVNSLLQGRVDGVVGVFFHLTAKELLPLLEQGIAVVRLEAMPKEAGKLPLDNLYIDNIAAAKEAVSYLISKGHTRIGMLAGVDGPSSFRVKGYQEALEQHKLKPDTKLIQRGSYNEEGGFETMQTLLALAKPPTAIFAANDLMAMGAMSVIHKAGLRIPNDIAVMGFDDIPSAKLMNPSLSSVAQEQRRMGQRAADMLFERLSATAPPNGRSEEMPYQLILRESA
jgi:LacI family transcriptional regulator